MMEVELDYEDTNAQPNPTIPKEVCLNRAILLKGISNVNCDKRDPAELDKQFPRLTHLHLQNKGIDILESFHQFKNLTVLYLYDNRIRKIFGLEEARHLESLYLQRNKIESVDGLQGCRKLRKLYLGQNEILVVEGLQHLNLLQELHIEQQRFQLGEQLVFDPLTLDALSNSLQILNIRDNQMTSIEDLAGMEELHTLDAQGNAIIDLDKTSIIIKTLANLKVLDLRGNPMTKSPKYQEKMLGHCQTVELLDGKSYSAKSRHFISKFCEMKAAHIRQNISAMNPSVHDTTSHTSRAGSLEILSSTQDSSIDIQDSELKQIYPPRYQRHRPEEALDKNRAELNMQGQVQGKNLQAQMDLIQIRRLGSTKLVNNYNPQEMAISEFVVAPQPTMPGEFKGCGDFQKTFQARKSSQNVLKGLASRISSQSSIVAPAAAAPSGKNVKRWACPKKPGGVEGMMPTSSPISRIKGFRSSPAQREYAAAANHSAANLNVQQNLVQAKSRLAQPKVFTLPPWPHIMRNVRRDEEPMFF